MPKPRKLTVVHGPSEAVTIEARCAELMREHGTVRAAAKAAGLSFTYFWRLSKGEATAPSDDTLKLLGLQQQPTVYTRRKS